MARLGELKRYSTGITSTNRKHGNARKRLDISTEWAAFLAIKAKTDQLTFTVANRLDVQALGIGSGVITSASFAAGAIDANAIATDALGSSELAAAAATEIANAVISAGGSVLTAQQVADALKLAPTAGSAAEGSVYDTLDEIQTTGVPSTGGGGDATESSVQKILRIVQSRVFRK